MKEIKIIFNEFLPDGKRRRRNGKILIHEEEHLRRKLHDYCNELCEIEFLGKYRKDTPIGIQLKNSDMCKYCEPFYINHRGNIIPLGDYYYLHNWTYTELVNLRNEGLTSGNIDTIVVNRPMGLGGGEDIIQNIAYQVFINMIIKILDLLFKRCSDYIMMKYYEKKHKKHITTELQKEILARKNKWKIEKIQNYFCLSKREAERLLHEMGYEYQNGYWIKKNK